MFTAKAIRWCFNNFEKQKFEKLIFSYIIKMIDLVIRLTNFVVECIALRDCCFLNFGFLVKEHHYVSLLSYLAVVIDPYPGATQYKGN